MSQLSNYGRPRITILGAALRKARKDASDGLRELARRIDANPALLSNWEFGQRTPSLEDVAAILGALGASGDDKKFILHLARTTEPSVIILGDQDNPGHAMALRACDDAASSITLWNPMAVPELLQLHMEHA
ncbi:hypothetical protein GCM10022222_00100 [Amycolatopsis ultiminotia]|uniref:HTH cro/C1-type domain-containing protein n=1 Tax=Amycolatopsis ultiminotia TaxID=543629 RepID=A0ABP6UTP7_9PSEU